MKKRIVVLSGAGISAESGIKTFRDSDGLWENYRIEDVATYDAWLRNRTLVLDFYNQRRRQLLACVPNEAHFQLVRLEEKYDVHIVTQNVDDLHERAGSANVLHLHGELLKVRSTKDETIVYDWKSDMKEGDVCALGSQLRPHIVWFGEQVPMLERAAEIVAKADILIVVGTSLVVYPAAGLVHYTDFAVPKYVVDPGRPSMAAVQNVTYIEEKATTGISRLVKELLEEA
jgi:NAD-dependent deacetylase